MSAARGRKGNNRVYRDTVKRESAEQGMLKKQDEIIDRINAIVNALEAAADTAAINTAMAALADLSKVVLK